MFGEQGFSYVYLIYGMYHCLNIVTEEKGNPSAVLVRGLKLANIHLDGPGKICKYLGLNKSHNGINLVSDGNLYLTSGIEVEGYKATSRIGIKKALDKQWRFVIS
jgi:DNA-3-methyladenine glycosylase